MSTKVLFRRLISIASPPSLPSAPPSTPQMPPLPAHRQHLPQPYLAPIPQTAPTPARPSPRPHTTDSSYPSPTELPPIQPQRARHSHRELPPHTIYICTAFAHLIIRPIAPIGPISPISSPHLTHSESRIRGTIHPLGAGIPRPISSPQIGDEKRSR